MPLLVKMIFYHIPAEGSGGESDRGEPPLLEFSHVVDKPRRARPSISGGGHHRLALPGHPVGVFSADVTHHLADGALVVLHLQARVSLLEQLSRSLQGHIAAVAGVHVQD